MRYFILALTAALAALAISAPAPAAGSGRVIRFIEVERTSTHEFIDLDHNGIPASGESIMESTQLYAWAKGGGRGARIGHAKIMCTFEGVSTSNPENVRGAFCQGTLFLPGGTVVALGYVRFAPNTVTLPVIGGTGAYAGARGVFNSRTIRDYSEVTVSADVIRLMP